MVHKLRNFGSMPIRCYMAWLLHNIHVSHLNHRDLYERIGSIVRVLMMEVGSRNDEEHLDQEVPEKISESKIGINLYD